MLNIGRICVIVPVYNTQAFLAKCLRSLSEQSYENMEIILVNDGSTDESGRLCDQAAEGDSRIRVIHQHNRGLSAARNAGLDCCDSEFVFFLDSDDWLAASCLEGLAISLDSHGADVAMCRLARVSAENDPLATIEEWERSFPRLEGLLFIDRTLSGLMAVSCGKLYKRELFSGIRFPEGRYHEDEFTTYRLLYAAQKMVIINQYLYFHRIRDASITQSSLSFPRARDAVEAFLERYYFFQDEGAAELASSAQRYMFYMYREYTRELKKELSSNEADEWQKLGRNVYAALKEQNHPVRFRISYEAFFRILGVRA